MNNVILKSSVRILTPMIFLFSIIVLLKGHNDPGGGFIGGLLGALSWVVYRLGTGNAKLPVNMIIVMSLGLSLCLASGLYSVFMGAPYLTGFWGPGMFVPTLGKVKLATPLFFDIGVYTVVFCGAVRMLNSFMKD
jgi:multicomponent Na+:H+ antiporter subunit B